MKRDSLVGKKFGRYEVLSFVEIKNSRTIWLCKCDCGNQRKVNQNNITRNPNPSCGCSRRKPKPEGFAKHNLHGTPIYPIWIDMKRRCENPNRYTAPKYHNKGVRVCEEWQDVRNFYKWCLDNGWTKGLCVCRKKDLGNYSPDNCYIATKSQNAKEVRTRIYAN